MSDQKRSSGESFAGNVMKYSVATYLGFAITGLALIVKGLLPAEVLGAPVTFIDPTQPTIMNIGILGLDQALLRFYHEPPAGAEPRQLFAACTRISAAFMMLLGVAAACSLRSRWQRRSVWAAPGRALCHCCSSTRRCICWCAT